MKSAIEAKIEAQTLLYSASGRRLRDTLQIMRDACEEAVEAAIQKMELSCTVELATTYNASLLKIVEAELRDLGYLVVSNTEYVNLAFGDKVLASATISISWDQAR